MAARDLHGPGAPWGEDFEVIGRPHRKLDGLAKATGWGERMVPEMVDWFSALFDDTRKP